MKLSESLIAILKNFQGINNSIYFPGGHEFRSRDIQKTIFCEATVPEGLPSMGVFDLSSLLQYFRMVKDPDIEVDGDCLIIAGNGTKVKYTLADKDNLVIQEEPINIPEEPFAKIAFTLDVLETVQTAKNIGVTKSDTVEYKFEGGMASVSVYNSESPTSNVVSKEISCETQAAAFSMSFKTEQFVMLPGNYTLELFLREKNGTKIFLSRYVGEGIKYVTPAKMNANNYIKI